MILKINPPFINLVRLSAILSLNIGYSNPDISKAQFDLELEIRKRSGIKTNNKSGQSHSF